MTPTDTALRSYDKRRITTLPGVKTVATLYPDKLGTKLKGTLIEALHSDASKFGWSSKSRQLFDALRMTYGIATCHATGSRIFGWHFPPTVKKLTKELAVAGFTAKRLRGEVNIWMRENFEKELASLERGSVYINLQYDDAANKVLKAFAKWRAKDTIQRQRIDELIAHLENNTPIPLLGTTNDEEAS